MTDAADRPAGSFSPGSFLARLAPEQQKALLALGVKRALPAGRVLFREGEAETTHVEILLRGYVKVTTVAEGVQTLLSVRGPGDILGETASLNGGPRTATVTACSPVTAIVVSRTDFHQFLHRYPDAAMSMAATMGDRLRWANRRRSETAAFSAEVRLARLLVDLAPYGRVTEEGICINVPLSQPELATMVGIADATAEKAFASLRRNGLIRTGYRRIVIVHIEALRALGDVA